MSRTPRNSNSPPVRNVHAKRICIERVNQTAKGVSLRQNPTSCLWSENDASFLSHAKLEDMFSGQDSVLAAPFSSLQQSSSIFRQMEADDSLFSDISIASPRNSNDEMNQEEQQCINAINMSEFSIVGVEDIFHDADEYANSDVQSTQLFLDALPPEKKQITRMTDESIFMSQSMSFISKSILEGIVQGTQYETYETLKNRSMLQNQNDLAGLDDLDWQTQAFPEFESTKNDYSFPSKGDFYGLPEQVKNLIFEHKGINSLYGK